MNRRVLLPLLAVSGMLTAGSLLPRIDGARLAGMAAVLRDAVVSLPPVAVRSVGIAAAALLALILVLRLRSGRTARPAFGLDLGSPMEDAIPATAGMSRRVAVAHLAESGRSVPAIARETRLGQDAVRGMVGVR